MFKTAESESTVTLTLTISEAETLMNIIRNPSVEPSEEPEDHRYFRYELFDGLVNTLGDAAIRNIDKV